MKFEVKKTHGQESTPGNRTRLYAVLTFLLAAILLFVCVLPPAVGFALKEILKNAASDGSFECEVSQIGLFRANASITAKIRDNGKKRTVFSLPDCKLLYSPLSLLRGKIEGLTVTGPTIRVNVLNGRWSLPVAEMFANKKKALSVKETPSEPFSGLPFGLKTIQLRNAVVLLNTDGKIQYIPLNAVLKFEKGKLSLFSAVQLAGQPLGISGTWVSPAKTGKLGTAEWKIRTKDFNLENLPRPLSDYAEKAGLAGIVELEYKSGFDFDRKLLQETLFDLKAKNFRMEAAAMRSPDFSCRFHYRNGAGTMNISDLSVTDALRFDKAFASFMWSPGKGVSGKAEIQTESKTVRKTGLLFTVRNAKKSGAFLLEVKPKPGGNGGIVFPNGTSVLFSNLSANISTAGKTMSLDAGVRDFTIRDRNWNAVFSSLGTNLQYRDGLLAGKAEANLDRAEYPQAKISVRNARMLLPFRQGAKESGSLTIETILIENIKQASFLGSMETDLGENFKKNRFGFKGKFHIGAFPELEPEIASETVFGAGMFRSENSLRLAETFFPETDLGKLSPALAGMKASGKFTLAARCEIGKNTPFHGNFRAGISDASCSVPGADFSIEGFSGDFALLDFSELRTPPGMFVSFRKMRSGKISASDFVMFYRMENPKLWTMEKMRANWADGVIRAESTRFDLDKNAFDLTFHCEKVKLGEIFRQFGKAYAEGDGTLSGIVPFAYRNGKIDISEGFLNSTPGVSGILKLSGTEMLTAGIPEDSPFHAQLEFSQEALKDFSYEWAKLNFQGKDGILKLQTQLSGKPLRPLPFVYRNGRFFKTDSRVYFGGIRLDVNFSIPMTRLMNIAEKMQNLTGGLKK